MTYFYLAAFLFMILFSTSSNAAACNQDEIEIRDLTTELNFTDQTGDFAAYDPSYTGDNSNRLVQIAFSVKNKGQAACNVFAVASYGNHKKNQKNRRLKNSDNQKYSYQLSSKESTSKSHRLYSTDHAFGNINRFISQKGSKSISVSAGSSEDYEFYFYIPSPGKLLTSGKLMEDSFDISFYTNTVNDPEEVTEEVAGVVQKIVKSIDIKMAVAKYLRISMKEDSIDFEEISMGELKKINFNVRANVPFKVTASSLNNSHLRLIDYDEDADDDHAKIRYILKKYGTPIGEVSSETPLKILSKKTPKLSNTGQNFTQYKIKIEEDPAGHLAGSYTDTITFTVSEEP